MNDGATRRGDVLTTVVLFWAAAVALLALLWQPMILLLWIFMEPALMLAVAVSVTLLAVTVAVAVSRRRHGRSATTAVRLVLLQLLMLGTLWWWWQPLSRAGDATCFRVHWWLIRGDYARTVAWLTAPPSAAASPHPPVAVRESYEIDSGPPVRVAFVQHGMLDNWEGVVYDPTGAVAAATGWRAGVPGEFTAPPAVRELFGGDLVACDAIEPNWYRCWFT